jgi:hypothetical protein
LNGKIEKLKEEIVRLNAINAEMMKSEDKQISLTDPRAATHDPLYAAARTAGCAATALNACFYQNATALS